MVEYFPVDFLHKKWIRKWSKNALENGYNISLDIKDIFSLPSFSLW